MPTSTKPVGVNIVNKHEFVMIIAVIVGIIVNDDIYL